MSEIISEGRYLDKKSPWKEAVRRYQEEHSLEESIFMEDDEFESLEHVATYNENTLKIIEELLSCGFTRSPTKMEDRKDYFIARNRLVDVGIIVNSVNYSLSDKGRTFLLECGRRSYDS